ncbi:hypothetical protein SCHPADRAFT_916374 [Schizopora paradoxa]|uniref:B-related factor 1 n=1 Tax=Schizopora paradoxa TaxID=27342 RepID=A0A0H2REU9_9AGAM|nr:hypothetical protein SCHPADRAFT_916374 [Schizopora paradoxa]
MPVCNDCGGTVIEYDAAAGNGFCVKCGTVVEENTIVSEVTFGETSNGAAMVQGSFVGQGSTHARMGGPFGNRGASESREQTIQNASRKIHGVAHTLRLSEVIAAAAIRLYTLAVEHKFTKGRKNMNVIAVCLYVACRQKETRKYMLIDFSDILQVNVFELGHTYLQLVQTLNLHMPLVDPSHYISRFASLLEFGDATSKVAADAARLVQRFERDWISFGRRPAGICGACLLLAARMNNFRRSVAEIVQVVRIADTTLKKRLDEFRKTPSGNLSLADFRTVWLDEEVDPPAFTRGKEKEAREAKLREGLGTEDEEDDEQEEVGRRRRTKKKKKDKKGKKRKRGEGEEGEDIEGVTNAPALSADNNNVPQHIPIDPQLLNEGILEGTLAPEPTLFLPEEGIPVNAKGTNGANPSDAPSDIIDAEADDILAEEVNQFLSAPEGQEVNAELDAAEEEERRRREAAAAAEDELKGLDEEELDAFLLSEDEIKMKERVWVEINRDYLEALAAKGEPKDDQQSKSRKKRKTNNKPRDASTPSGSTAGESVRNLLKKNPKYSKRINYDALADLFDGNSLNSVPTNIDLDEKEDEMYHLSENEKSDGEGAGMALVVVEGGGGVGMAQKTVRRPNTEVAGGATADADASVVVEEDGAEVDADADADADADGEIDASYVYEEGDTFDDGKSGDYAWEDGYEQEV